MGDTSLKEHIRRARGKFIAMAATYSLGVFNDNFFKQAAMLMAVAAGRETVQGHAIVIFALPYLAFAAYAGWMADRFSKRHVVIGAKFLELAAMICGAIGICTGCWPLILLMVGLMGLQSSVFSPALNGSIPELYPASYVTTANGYLKVAVTGAILLGIALAGFALDRKGEVMGGIALGRASVAGIVLLVSALGVAGSFGVPHRPAAAPGLKVPWSGPLFTLRELCRIRKDSLLATVVAANVFVWFTGSLEVLIINLLGMKQLGIGESRTSGLVVSQLAGLAVGGLLSGKLARGERWHRVLPPAAAGMAVLMLAMGAVPHLPEGFRVPCCFVLLPAIGLLGGIFMIPCEAFIQVRPDPREKGTVIAAANFAVFCGILLSGPVVNLLGVSLALRPTSCFALLGCLALLAAGALRIALPKDKRE